MDFAEDEALMENDYESMIMNERRTQYKYNFGKKKPYGTRKTRAVQSLYVISALLWIALILLLGLYRTDRAGILILSLPLFVFAFGFINSGSLSVEVEEDMSKANYLSIGLLVVLPLLTYLNNDYKGSAEKRRHFMTIIIVALILTMLSLVDIWVKKKWITLMKHIKSILQTASLTLIIFALYIYYVDRTGQLM